MLSRTPPRKCLLIILLVMISASQASTVSAGFNVWTSIGPEGERINSLTIDPATPTTLYAGGNAGVYKSTNGGGNWSAVNTGTSVLSLAIDPATPTTLYARTSGGVFKSTNGGGNWSAVNTDLTDLNLTSLAIDPATPTTLYAGTNGGGVFKSTNGGGNWSAVNTGLTYTSISSLAIDPATPTTLYAVVPLAKSTNNGGVIKSSGALNNVFKSTNGGASWSAVNTSGINNYVLSLAIDPATPTTLYAGTYNGGVFVVSYTNEGNNLYLPLILK